MLTDKNVCNLKVAEIQLSPSAKVLRVFVSAYPSPLKNIIFRTLACAQ